MITILFNSSIRYFNAMIKGLNIFTVLMSMNKTLDS